MKYLDKLKDPRWQKKRLKVMERDLFTCAACGDNKSTLNVHHLKYGKDPWSVDDKYLVTLCEKCHEDIERFKLKVVNISMLKIIRHAYDIDGTIVCFISCEGKLILSITRFGKNVGFNISAPKKLRSLIEDHFGNLKKLGLLI